MDLFLRLHCKAEGLAGFGVLRFRAYEAGLVLNVIVQWAPKPYSNWKGPSRPCHSRSEASLPSESTWQNDDMAQMSAFAVDALHVLVRRSWPGTGSQALGRVHVGRSGSFCCGRKVASQNVSLAGRHHSNPVAAQKKDATCLSSSRVKSHVALSHASLVQSTFSLPAC